MLEGTDSFRITVTHEKVASTVKILCQSGCRKTIEVGSEYHSLNVMQQNFMQMGSKLAGFIETQLTLGASWG